MKAIFWDNDGILVDTEHLYFQATQEVLATVGIPLTEAEYVELFLVQSKGAWHLAAERGHTPEQVRALRARREERYSELVTESPRVLAGVPDVLAELHGRYTMGIVTSSHRRHFDAVHRTTGLLPYFDFVITGDDVARLKPHPEPYLAAIARSGVPPADCVAIEDSTRGLTAARAAGIRCFVVPSALTRASDFSAADAVLGSVRDVVHTLAAPYVAADSGGRAARARSFPP